MSQMHNNLVMTAAEKPRPKSENSRKSAGSGRMEMARYLAFAFCTADALVELDPSGSVVFASGATRRLFSLTPDDMAGKPFDSLAIDSEKSLLQAILARAAIGERFHGVPISFARADAPDILLSLNGYGVPDLSNHCFITAKAAEIGRDFVHDHDREATTGLLRKDAFEDSVKAHIEKIEAGVEKGELTFVGLVGMPELAERLSGPDRQLLQHRLGTFLIAVSLDGETAAQLGDNKFGLLHNPGLDIGTVEGQLSEFTRDADPEGIGATVSAQSADIGSLDASGEELAEALLYTTRRVAEEGNEEGAAGILSANIAEQLSDSAANIKRVKVIIESAKFDVAYQAIVSLEDRNPHHFEALVRLTDKSLEMTPYEFICFAEDIGLIADFDIELCRKVIGRINLLARKGNVLPVAVNLSGRSIESEAFIKEFRALLADNSEISDKLMFEITETSRIKDLERANATIHSLREDGFQVCLDDFGAGQAAFEYLRELDVDFVKIDGKYVKDATSSAKGKAFLVAMANQCQDLGIATIAELVEDEETVEFLKECGIAYGQGYFFHKPEVNADLLSSKGGSARKKQANAEW